MQIVDLNRFPGWERTLFYNVKEGQDAIADSRRI